MTMTRTIPIHVLLLTSVVTSACGDDTSGNDGTTVGTTVGTTGGSTVGSTGAPDDGSTSEPGADSSGDPDPDDPSRANTDAGPLTGQVIDGIRTFLGIPYVAPPLDSLRFSPPQPHPGWDEPRPALEFGPACPQLDMDTDVYFGQEDCLTLNVWAPEQGQGRAVMVWIHGGGFLHGASDIPQYDGATLAKTQDVVVVSFNYRLGALGYLASPELLAEGGGTTGNFGLRDQIAALEWVQANITQFGGDPQRVTVFGESAGGASVGALLGSPQADGLYQGAIIQSAGESRLWPTLGDPQSDPLAFGSALTAAVGCDGVADPVACLREVSPEDLVTATGPLDPLGPLEPGVIIDGELVPTSPYERISSGQAPAASLFIGFNADEFGPLSLVLPIPDEATYQLVLGQMFPEVVPELLALYPPAAFGDPARALSTLLSETTFVCPSLALTDAAPSPVYSYVFAHTLPGEASEYGAFHSLEAPYVFGNLDALPFDTEPTEDDEVVSALLRDAWGHFAREGTPGPSWPAWNEGQVAIELTTTPSEITDVDQGRCAQLSALGVI
ncbi:MAG: carboxylesterase family protein [Myxococcota bacterium]